jgi:Zn-dependent protease
MCHERGESGLAMRDQSSWSVSLGRWVGVNVGVHSLFLFFAVFVLFLSASGSRELHAYGAIGLAILFASVLIHEVAHAVAAVRLGGVAEQIIIGPLGGLTVVSVPHHARRETLAILAGPVANLGLFFTSGVGIVLLDGDPVGLLNPLNPRELTEPSLGMAALKLTCWLNWLLFWVNLLPAYPLDGGPALRSWLTPAVGRHTAVMVVSRTAKLTAIALCVLAFVVHDRFESNPIPAWLPLVSLAIFVFFAARAEADRLDADDMEEDLLGYDFSQGYTSLERQLEPPQRVKGPSSAMRRWIDARREARRRRQELVEQAEESRFDEILCRIHVEGMSSLTAEERALLNRVSARYRSRQSQYET